jgi:hypothetical protein
MRQPAKGEGNARIRSQSRRTSPLSSVMATKQKNNERGGSIIGTDTSLVYKPPRSATRRFFWRWRILLESTFALTMVEGWEKILIGASSPLSDDVF